MEKVVGGEFGIIQELLERRDERELKEDIRFSSGRDALYHIFKDIEKRNVKKIVLIPDYICDSVKRTVVDAGWRYECFHVNQNFTIDFNQILPFLKQIKVVVLVNYFGMTKDNIDNIQTMIREQGEDVIVVEDDVQAFFDISQSQADYCFTSLRKWFPCPDGAIVKCKYGQKIERLSENREVWSDYKFVGNFLKQYDCPIEDELILNLLNKGEDFLDKKYISVCTEISKVIFSNIDLVEVSEIRKENARYLHLALNKMCVEHLYTEKATPLFVPIIVDDRDILRSRFFENKIFTPIHWPVHNSRVCSSGLVGNEISLICDQRYGLKEMERQINILESFLRGR